MLANSNVDGYRGALDNLRDMSTPPDKEDPPIYRALVQLKPDRFENLGQWATAAGLARNYFNVLRGHGNPNTATLEALLKAAEIDRGDFDALVAPVRSEVIASPRARDRRSAFAPEPPKPLEVLGTALGCESADLDEDVELMELVLGDVLGYRARPYSLANDNQAYAVRIVGESMWPRFKPGEDAAVSPRASIGIGDDVIVQLRTDDGIGGERINMVLVKELVRRTASFIELRQYKPDITFKIPAARVAKIHRVTGVLF